MVAELLSFRQERSLHPGNWWGYPHIFVPMARAFQELSILRKVSSWNSGNLLHYQSLEMIPGKQNHLHLGSADRGIHTRGGSVGKSQSFRGFARIKKGLKSQTLAMNPVCPKIYFWYLVRSRTSLGFQRPSVHKTSKYLLKPEIYTDRQYTDGYLAHLRYIRVGSF